MARSTPFARLSRIHRLTPDTPRATPAPPPPAIIVRAGSTYGEGEPYRGRPVTDAATLDKFYPASPASVAYACDCGAAWFAEGAGYACCPTCDAVNAPVGA